MSDEREDTTIYTAVVNHEEQYSIWPEFKDIPAGWLAVGPQGTKDECLDYIEKIWTDMRPKSLRDKMKSPEDPTPAPEAKSAAEAVIAAHKREVEQYGAGKPELYGWFVARAFEKHPDLEPAAVRAALDEALPPHNVPANYA